MSDGIELKCGGCLSSIGNEDKFCGECGQSAEPVILIRQCPECAARYDDDAQFCMNDGLRLEITPIAFVAVNRDAAEIAIRTTDQIVRPEPMIDGPTVTAQPEHWRVQEGLAAYSGGDEKSRADESNFGTAPFSEHFGETKLESSPFWERHKVMSIMTTVYLIALVPVASADRADGARFVMIVLGIPLLASWFVALSNSERVLAGVGRMDEWFVRSKNYMGNSNGKIRRWLMYPLLWVADKWVTYALKTEDRFSSAALRVFGYVVTFALIAMLAYFVIALVVVLALLAITIFLLSVFVDGPSLPRHGGRLVGGVGKRLVSKQRGKIFAENGMILGRRGDKIYRGTGGFFGSEELVGRVDADGNIYEGTGGLWGSEQKIGRIDEDGRIHEGTGGFWGHDEAVGRIDENGTIHEGSGGVWGHEQRAGRINKDGQIYEGSGGLWGTESRSGRSKK